MENTHIPHECKSASVIPSLIYDVEVGATKADTGYSLGETAINVRT
jgi:hypothetical protein